jgi:hypothetical protein
MDTFPLSTGAFMTKISGLRTPSSCPLSDSLSLIRQTHVQLHA